MYHQKKWQNVMSTREIIGQQMHLQGKKEKRNECQRNYRTSSLSMECAITKFHQIVSQGPLYVYTCCG